MKLLTTGWLIVALAVVGYAQNPANETKSATVEGIVVKEPGGEPVKKALVELIAENQTQGGDYTALSGLDGTFRIDRVLPGRYHLFAERTGMLEADRQQSRGEGRVLTLTAGQEVKELRIRLQAAAVVKGRVTDEDGDPLADAQVSVLRQTYKLGHSHWEQVGGERTNDIGEFRVPNLPAGNYYVSVSPPPDFRSLIEAGGAAPKEDEANAQSTSYQTMYYPGTPDRSQAAPIQLHAGDEFPMNFTLTPSASLSIRGAVVNLPPHSSASVMLQSRDFGLILNGAEIHKDGSFVIRDVSPGSYTISATVENAPTPMMARQSLHVANSIDGLRLAPQPGATVRGRLRVEGKGNAMLGISVDVFASLESTDASEDATSVPLLTHVANDGNFEWKDVAPGNYYVRLIAQSDAGQDWFVKSVLNGGSEVRDTGVVVNGGITTVDLLASTQGAIADGIVVDSKGQPIPNAVVVAVPEPRLRTREDHYRKTVSDQAGQFTLRGIPPGDYTLFAWDNADGDAYYNPDFLRNNESQGTALHLNEGDKKSFQLPIISIVQDEP
jgi:protocatechuate 3,4-dioxygenase beta subunit